MAAVAAVTAAKKPLESVTFYGADFSCVNVIGAQETPEQFIEAFSRINQLFITEAEKYNVGKYMKLNVEAIDVTTAKKQAEKLKGVKFMDKTPEAINYEALTACYPKTEGKCLLIVACELNKSKNTGSFIQLIFDGQSGAVISTRAFWGYSRGFGLRNYWAGAIYSGLNAFSYRGDELINY